MENIDIFAIRRADFSVFPAFYTADSTNVLGKANAKLTNHSKNYIIYDTYALLWLFMVRNQKHKFK